MKCKELEEAGFIKERVYIRWRFINDNENKERSICIRHQRKITGIDASIDG